MRMHVCSAILLAAMIGCGPSQDDIKRVTESNSRTWTGVVGMPQKEPAFAIKEVPAVEFVETHYVLGRLAPEAQKTLGRDNAMVRDVLQTLDRPGASGDFSPNLLKVCLEAVPTKSDPIIPQVDPRAKPLWNHLDQLSRDYTTGALRGNFYELASVEAKLTLRLRTLKQAMGAAADSQLPQHALGLLPEESLKAVGKLLESQKNFLKPFGSLFPHPELEQTLHALDEQLALVNALVQKPDGNRFHLARDALPDGFNMYKWETGILEETRLERAETAGLIEQYEKRYPLFKWNPIPVREKVVADFPRSSHCLDAVRYYWVDPSRWLSAEAALGAELGKLQKLPLESQKAAGISNSLLVNEWIASNLNDRDLAAAVGYTKEITKGFVEMAPYNPNDLGHARYKELHAALVQEQEQRMAGAVAGARRYPIQNDHKAFAVFTEFYGTSRRTMGMAEAIRYCELAASRYSAPGSPATAAKMPAEIAKNIRSYHRGAFLAECRRSNDLLQEYRSLQELASLVDGVGIAEIEKLKNARKVLAENLARLQEYYLASSSAGFIEPLEEYQKLKAWASLLASESRGPPYNRPPHLPIAGDAALQEGLRQASAELKGLTKPLQNLPKVRPYAQSPGRWTAQLEEVKALSSKTIKMPEIKNTEPRLPNNFRDFEGRQDPRTNKPYPFEDVLKGKKISPLGGGIHFGNAARLQEDRPVSNSVLSYSIDRKEMILVLPSAYRFRYGPIEPEDLKTLWRFAQTDQNVAVSIGWSGTSRPQEEASQGKTVFLDPLFVDTAIGLDLFVTDQIPWKFGDPVLPNGKTNPIANEFKVAKSADLAMVRNRMKGIVASVSAMIGEIKALDDSTAAEWVSSLGKDRLSALIRVLLLRDKLEDARRDFILQSGFRSEAEFAALVLQPVKNKTSLEMESRILFAQKTERLITSLLTPYYELPHQIDKYRWILSLAAVPLESGSCETKRLQLVIALLKAVNSSRSVADIAHEIIELLPSTMLAVLLDEPTLVTLEGGRLDFLGKMRWMYVARQVSLDESGLHASAPGDREEEIEQLPKLAQVTNESYKALQADFAPLSRIAEAARIVAFLRWAKQGGVAIDFATLAGVQSQDPTKWRTPDAVSK